MPTPSRSLTTPVTIDDRIEEQSDIPESWRATLAAIVHGPESITPAARFWGAVGEMVREGWIEKWQDPSGKAQWTLTPMAAGRLGVALVEIADGEPRWTVFSGHSDPTKYTPHPDGKLVLPAHPHEEHPPDYILLNIADPHSDPTTPEARRRARGRGEGKARHRGSKDR
jgi:hypothetical protein